MKPASSAKKPVDGPQADTRDKTGVLTLSTFLPYQLSVVATVASEGLARIYNDRFGISIPEWRVVATIGEFNSISAKAIGQHAHMDKVKVSRAATSLEARKLIRRRSNPSDLREAFLVLTPAGQAIYDEIVPLAFNYVDRLTSNLSPDEQVVLNGLLEKLLCGARQMSASSRQSPPKTVSSRLAGP